jgi:hypothetical protein
VLRTFWTVYVITSFLPPQIRLSTPSFTSEDLRLPLPVEDGRFEMGTNESGGLGWETLTSSSEDKSVVSELGQVSIALFSVSLYDGKEASRC